MSPHGHRAGHPRRKCPLTCAHRQWLESYDVARDAAVAAREDATGNWHGDLVHYAATMPPLPTLREWMARR